jgi:catechol 2,3-dioxygenase-like lactoylglutathione lyase family enzyme
MRFCGDLPVLAGRFALPVCAGFGPRRCCHPSTHGARWPSGNGAVAISVRDVDALHGELVARGVNVLKPPRNHAHGVRDFDVSDPDGNQLTFGMATRSASGAAANE